MDFAKILNDYLTIDFLLEVLYFLVLLFVGIKLIKFIIKRLDSFLRKKEVDKGVANFSVSVAKVGLYIFLILQILIRFGVDTTSFVAVLASLSFAVGMALQGSLSNFAGGVLILIQRPFKIGDYIEGASHAGTVKDIAIFYTYLTTPDNKQIMIPNGALSNGSIVNYSTMDTRRVDLEFGVGYESDNALVKETIESVLLKHEFIMDDPKPFVRLATHGDSALVYKVRVWVKKENYWDVYFDLMEQVKDALDEQNISIPYPHVQIAK